MKKKIGNDLITAVALIVIGALFIIYKSEIISIAMSIIGVTLIVLGIVDAVRKFVVSGVVKIVFGVLVLVAGWLFITLALYILGAFLLIAGITELYKLTKVKIKKMSLPVAMHIAQPIIYILVAICLFFNQGGALSWVFTVSGIFLIIDGIVALIGAFDKK
nr:hypothetical protein [Oscillospiraceae bacterium]